MAAAGMPFVAVEVAVVVGVAGVVGDDVVVVDEDVVDDVDGVGSLPVQPARPNPTTQATAASPQVLRRLLPTRGR